MSFFAEKEFSISSHWLQTYSLLLPITEKEPDYFSRHTCNCSWQRTEPEEGGGSGQNLGWECRGEGKGRQAGRKGQVQRVLESQGHRDRERRK